MEKGYYVILSEGEYSDYTPCYFVGQRQITQEEMDLVGKKLGDELYDWLDSFPERPTTNPYSRGNEKYDPVTMQPIYSSGLEDKWQSKMREWLTSQGFVEIPISGIPELNTSYSELPTNYKR